MPRKTAMGAAATVTLVMSAWLLTVVAGMFDQRTAEIDAAQLAGSALDAPTSAPATLTTADDDIDAPDGDDVNDDEQHEDRHDGHRDDDHGPDHEVEMEHEEHED